MPDASSVDPVQGDRNVLYGLLALESGDISRAQFVEACAAWATRKDVPLADVLAGRGWISADRRRELSARLETELASRAANGTAPPTLRGDSGTVSGAPRTVGSGTPTLRGLGDPADQSFELGPAVQSVAVGDSGTARQRYGLSHLHARGGIGQVWLAHDPELGRDVALKELRPESVANPTAVTRFVDEARVTGQLEHPGIIPVYELDRGGDGRLPFYTMRFVRGRTLSEAVANYHKKLKGGEAEALDLRELLTAFVTVCNTIAYAHSRGIIHRDLKGANVLVGDFGEVIVLDWGLAKAITPRSTAATAAQDRDRDVTPVPAHFDPAQVPRTTIHPSGDLTVHGQILGTPAYMPPEQAQGELDRLDQRSDVYSLGAMLYEILTGRAPYSGDDARAIVLQVLRESPPAPRQLVPQTPPALDAICRKAMSPKPEDRYPRAGRLARDVQHFLADEPVSAYPEPWPARLGRWQRRHRALVWGTVALLATVVVASIVIIVLQGRANRQIQEQRDLALQNEEVAKTQRHIAEENAGEARRQRDVAVAFGDFLTKDLLAQARTDKNVRSKKVTVEEVVTEAAKRIDKPDEKTGRLKFAGKPEAEAAVRATIGETLYWLGALSAAEPQLEKAIEIQQRVLGPDHKETLDTMSSLVELLRVRGNAGRAAELGHEVYRRCLDSLGPDHDHTMTAANNLALVLKQVGRWPEAERIWDEQIQIRKRVKGPGHSWTLNVMQNLGWLELDEGKFAAAEQVLRDALGPARRSIPDDPIICAIMSNLGVALTELGRWREAEEQLREAEAACVRIQGPRHYSTLIVRNNLARLFIREGRLQEALPLCQQNLEDCRNPDLLGPEHPKTLVAMDNLATVFLDQGKPAEARPLTDEALAVRRKKLSAGHIDLALSLELQGRLLIAEAKPAEAKPVLREALTIRRGALPARDYRTALAESLLGQALAETKRFDEAEPLLVGGGETLQASAGASKRQKREALERLVALYTAWGKPDKAAEWKARLKSAAQSSPP